MRTTIFAGALLCLFVQAQAEDGPRQPSPSPPTAAVVPMTSAEDQAEEASPFGVPEKAEMLARMRGGAGTTANDMKLDGLVAGNVATNVATGSNVIDAGSFANAAGLPTVIQNSGANVLIQNATIVNVQLQ